jgi:hypothetical protein
MKHAVEMTSRCMIYVPSFMTICSGIGITLGLLPSYLRGCSIGSFDGRDFLIYRWNDLTWYDVHIEFHNDRFRRWSNVKVSTSSTWETAVLVLLMEEIYEIWYWNGLPVAREITSVHVASSCFCKFHFNVSPHQLLGFLSGLFASGFPTKPCMHSCSPHACYTPFPYYLPWLDYSNLAECTIYEASHYAVFFRLFHPSSMYIRWSAPCFQIPSFLFLLIMSMTKFYTHESCFIFLQTGKRWSGGKLEKTT